MGTVEGEMGRQVFAAVINGFDPTRKRMSIVVRDNRNGQFYLVRK